ncbi:hypothetical protein ACSSVZ_001098 [Amorphus sp. MBR-141]
MRPVGCRAAEGPAAGNPCLERPDAALPAAIAAGRLSTGLRAGRHQSIKKKIFAMYSVEME